MNAITDEIYIGNYLDAQDLEALEAAGIRAIIGLNGERYDLNYGEHGIVRTKVFDLIDGAGNDPSLFLQAVDTLRHYKNVAAPLFVHCHAGKSRSAIVVAVHFIRDEGMELAEAMDLIASRRDIRITPGMQEALDFHLA